ncbi:MAG: CNNM domain-containing protein [Chloroflexota bacterium]
MTLENYIYLSLLVICIVLSAFFAGAETAFMSLSKLRVQHMIETKAKGARRVARLLEKPERLLYTVLLGNMFVNTAASALATLLAVSLAGVRQGALIATFGLTFILLIFGDSTPKTIAVRHNERVATSFARPMELISRLLMPVVAALSWITSRLTRAVDRKPAPHPATSTEEIRTLIRMGYKEGTVDEDEAEMLYNVFEFGDRPVREIMVPRTDIAGLEQGSKVADYFALYSRLPLS